MRLKYHLSGFQPMAIPCKGSFDQPPYVAVFRSFSGDPEWASTNSDLSPRLREFHIYIYICICMYVYVYIYIYIYHHLDAQQKKERALSTRPLGFRGSSIPNPPHAVERLRSSVPRTPPPSGPRPRFCGTEKELTKPSIRQSPAGHRRSPAPRPG